MSGVARTEDQTQRMANDMRRYTGLAAVRRFLDELGEWPKTDEEWAAALELYREDRGYVRT